jgi:hypothetical protein
MLGLCGVKARGGGLGVGYLRFAWVPKLKVCLGWVVRGRVGEVGGYLRVCSMDRRPLKYYL